MLGRLFLSALIASLVAVYAACSPNQSPDQLRRKTAEETATIKRDTKAVAEGVKDGLSNRRSVDLNKCSKDDLTSLPGVTDHEADRIIAERPYADPHQLVTRHILSEDEYRQVEDRVVVNR
jgi:DNA uptake protein ComE-like DNA-binding protein